LYEGKRGQRVADKVLELYPPNDQMQSLVQRDQDHFMLALEEATASFLQVGDDASKPIEDFPEPITKSSNRYLLDMTVERAALELGLADAGVLTGMSRTRTSKDLGLGNWTNPGGTVPRETWERAYGRFARELNIGIPIRVR